MTGVQPAGLGDCRAARQVADVAAVGEMGGEQRLHHLVGPAEAGGVAHQAVRVDRGRRAADALEAEQHALGAADLGDRGIEPAGAVLATELAHHVVGARHAERGACRG